MANSSSLSKRVPDVPEPRNTAGALKLSSNQAIEAMLTESSRHSLLRFSTAGSVDDGKSTLIGRLLNDSKNIYEDTLQSLQSVSEKNKQSFSEALAYLTDGLRAEREQGITIDVAYRYFSTPKRHFILADTPGHEQYTRNMATGASTANLMILLVDARLGVITQTKRHAFIGSLLGIPRFLVTVNKMDLVNYSQEVFEKIHADFIEFAAKLGIKDVRFVPVSALQGDNIVEPSRNMPWHSGETVMQYLENVYVEGDINLIDFRFPVQCIIRPHQDYRGCGGQIVSGVIRAGEEVVVLPSMKRSRVASIDVYSPDPAKRQLAEAFAPMSVTLTLEHDLDIARGDMIVRTHNMPRVVNQFEAMLIWMGDQIMAPEKPLIIRHTTRESKVFVDQISYKVDVNTLSRLPGGPLHLNEIGRVSLTSTKALLIDPYSRNRATGSFILVDPASNLTVGAGMIIDRLPEELLPVKHPGQEASGQKSGNIHAEDGAISRREREAQTGFRAVTLWFTGLSGSGKSSIAKEIERRLFEAGRTIYRLDGDNLRFGLNRDLGFTREDRSENIRRAAEVARLFNQAGVSVISSFISPFKSDRASAREIVGANEFIEVYFSTPLEVCETRDPHGLYLKARSGEIKEFTGLTSPYEPPESPEIVLNTEKLSIEDSVRVVLAYLEKFNLKTIKN